MFRILAKIESITDQTQGKEKKNWIMQEDRGSIP